MLPKAVVNASVNSSRAQPPPPSGLLRGICPPSVPGVGHLQILPCPGAGHLPTPSFSHARGFLSEFSYTQDFTWKASRLAHFKAGKKLKRFVKACSRFYACISSLLIKPELHSETRELSTWINVFLLLNQVSLDIIWRTSFHIYKTIHCS